MVCSNVSVPANVIDHNIYLKHKIIKENMTFHIFIILNVYFVFTFIKIYICKLNVNYKCDIWLKSPITLNHKWNIG